MLTYLFKQTRPNITVQAEKYFRNYQLIIMDVFRNENLFIHSFILNI